MTRDATANVDADVVHDFGAEWSKFSNESLSEAELEAIFGQYTSIFPWQLLPTDPVGFDAGCGSGRWARLFAPRVGRLHCIDASEAALDVARRQLSGFDNVEFHCSDLNRVDLPKATFDFGYSLGVLHHIPDTDAATRACVELLKPGAPFLVYLYYSIGASSLPKRALFTAVTAVRSVISRSPRRVKQAICDAIAVVVYWPLARLARLVERLGRDPAWVPLAFYRSRSLYVMRNDALDRFGTRLEKRYSRDEVIALLERAGLDEIVVSPGEPYWVAVGVRRR
jgi:SAM-dependent methyltransferase